VKTIKGNALTGVSHLPFAGLSVFGSGFLNKFGAAVVPAPLLKGDLLSTFYFLILNGLIEPVFLNICAYQCIGRIEYYRHSWSAFRGEAAYV
jgi:hypothetical protein